MSGKRDNKSFFANIPPKSEWPTVEKDDALAVHNSPGGGEPSKKLKVEQYTDSPELYPLTNPPNEIIAAVAEALEAKLEDISHARGFDGGWEAWLQVELAVALTKKKYYVQRERSCWQPIDKGDDKVRFNGRCDLWVQSKPGEAWVIELKVQNKDEKNSDMITKFGADMAKLRRDMTPEALAIAAVAKVKIIKLLCICVTAEPSAVSHGWSALQTAVQSTVKCTWIPNDTNPNRLAMLWWQPINIPKKQEPAPLKKQDSSPPFHFEPPGSGSTGGHGPMLMNSGRQSMGNHAGFSYKL